MFSVAVVAILGTPGPTNTLLATGSAAIGVRRALLFVPAEGLGYLISILTLGLALGPWVAASPVLGLVLRASVSAYLFRLGWGLWQAGGARASTRLPLITPRQVFITTLLNPKAIIFALGIIPFGVPDSWRYVVGFQGLAAVCAVIWINIGAAMGGLATAAGRNNFIPRIGAVAVSGFALFLATSILLS